MKGDQSNADNVDVLSFIFLNIIDSNTTDVSEYLTSIETIESLTGLTFFTNHKELGISKQQLDKIKKRNADVKGESLTTQEKRRTYCSWKPRDHKLSKNSKKKICDLEEE